MPAFSIIKESKPKKSFRVASVMGHFDIESEKIREQFAGNIDIDSVDWNIGAIVGASGTGKSSIAKELFNEFLITNYEYKKQAIIDDMPKTVDLDRIFKAFNSVGFSSPPSWLKPYAVLSTGEKMRVDLARALLSENKRFVFDEFTSVVDRNVARVGSFAIQKAVRREKKQFIAVSCHKDILDWLEPDWVFDTDTMTFFLTAQNIQDQTLSSISQKQVDQIGKYSGNIII